MMSIELLERADAAVGPAADVLASVIGLEAALSQPRTRDDWLDVVAETQALVNLLTAVQDHAVAEVARRESVWLDDGTLGDLVHAPGRVTHDAADLVAPALGTSHAQGQRRVEAAVRIAADRVPVPAEQRELPTATGLADLQRARLDGRLDAYRAGIVATELEEAPAQVAETVLAALDPHLGDDGPTLRRRCRRLLARISPDLLRQRAVRARASTGLRRWVSEPGVDAWYGTFPSEESAAAWAAIDARAQELVAEGSCTSLEQARGRALTDLVLEHSTVDVKIVLTVPADADGHGVSHPSATASHLADDHRVEQADADGPRRAELAAAEDDLGARRDACAELVDTSHAAPRGPAAARQHAGGDLVEVHGARPSEPLLVSRAWLAGRLTTEGAALAACDPATGARVDLGAELATTA